MEFPELFNDMAEPPNGHPFLLKQTAESTPGPMIYKWPPSLQLH